MGEHRRRNNKERMTVIEQLEAMRDNFCENYCKYPVEVHQRYLADEINTEDEKLDYLTKHYCNNCPFMGL